MSLDTLPEKDVTVGNCLTRTYEIGSEFVYLVSGLISCVKEIYKDAVREL